MIVNHTYKFIFLRTEKTAGSSLSQALQRLGQEGDLAANMRRPPWSKFSPIHHGALKRKIPDLFGLHVHATAAQARRVLGPRIFDSYFKFAVERNPWDRQISLYMHRCWKTGRTPNFDKDILSLSYRATEHVRLNNFPIYTISGQVVADMMLRYETFEEDLEKLWETIGITPLALAQKRSEYREDRPHYSTFYTRESQSLVARWYTKDIAALGYTFEEN
ncbi:MAG: sulfotransferase family 2 domain-containing protein [Pseudomonadota bacterium]